MRSSRRSSRCRPPLAARHAADRPGHGTRARTAWHPRRRDAREGAQIPRACWRCRSLPRCAGRGVLLVKGVGGRELLRDAARARGADVRRTRGVPASGRGSRPQRAAAQLHDALTAHGGRWSSSSPASRSCESLLAASSPRSTRHALRGADAAGARRRESPRPRAGSAGADRSSRPRTPKTRRCSPPSTGSQQGPAALRDSIRGAGPGRPASPMSAKSNPSPRT